MPVLTTQQRNTLETAVKLARKLAETGARNALQAVAIDNLEPFAHMTPAQRTLRNRLRNKARLLGDALGSNGPQEINLLCYELAYENWHKMLFAKFLEANNLLMHPSGVAVTMEECEELAKEENFTDKWDAAAAYASKMLPAIFRPEDPLMQVNFASNDRIKLEEILDGLDTYIFTADDALGWVYQFWQSEAKEAINKSGNKIDGAKLPAVTQLFTEPYMVHFLIDNTIGAWWVSRNPGVKLPVKFEYLRVAPAVSVAPASSRSIIHPAGSRSYFNYFSPYEEIDNIKGNLPHWRQEGKIYFVTFRTADSMPQEKLKEWQEELDAWKKQNPEPLSREKKKEYFEKFPTKMQEYLDAGHGACELAKPEIKAVVENAIKHFDGDRYKVDKYVVAANHVHVLLEPLGKNQLSDILHSWKSYTGNEINKRIGKTGTFWQKEYFDHLVRSESSLEKFREYIRAHDKVAPASSRNDILRQDGGATLLKSSSVLPAGENEADAILRQDDGVTLPKSSSVLPAGAKAADAILRQDGGSTLFEGWPDTTAAITTLDPCMGSGHFVASLFPVLATLRMYEEGLTKEEATDKVITENLHGLELDARCTQIAAFNLALTAWKFCGLYKELPEMNLACSGIAPKGKKEDWVKLVDKEPNLELRQKLVNGMEMLYDHFQLAPELGSLLDPSTIKPDAFTASFQELQPALKRALENEADTEQFERGAMAAGIAKAGIILSTNYDLIITNVPYLGFKKQGDLLKKFCEKIYTDAKMDLATVFLKRSLTLASKNGTIATVTPQNWLFLGMYEDFRKNLLKEYKINSIALLGSGAFSQITGEVVKAILVIISKNSVPSDNHLFFGISCSDVPFQNKCHSLKSDKYILLDQKKQFNNPNARIVFSEMGELDLLENFSISKRGVVSGDKDYWFKCFWELGQLNKNWKFLQSTVEKPCYFGGKFQIANWSTRGIGMLRPGLGNEAYGNKGIVINQMGELYSSLYLGELYDNNIGVIVPNNEKDLIPIFAYCSSSEFNKNVRDIDQSLAVTNATLVKVPFDFTHWQKIAAEKYPNGLPKPYSDDATQWLFHGHPIKAENPLQVSLARLLGYRWPAEVESVEAASSGLINNVAGSNVYSTLADDAKELIKQVKAFDDLTDEDGILCIPPVNGELAGSERLRSYLQAVYGANWNNNTISQLFTKEGAKESNLEDWLRGSFFEQHCKLFQNRPFIWHIWDGRKDGFSALVNYHKLNKENLQRLIFTYLGDWIRQCEAKKKSGESGAEGLLSSANKLKEKLEAILEGEAPHDIFVRWKSLAQQSIGWKPDLNDGVRLNIRPFVEAGVLRNKFNVKWGVDRGKNPLGSHWGEVRDNDLHKSLEEKRKTRENKK